MLRKFYDAQAAEPTATSPVAAMAKFGAKDPETAVAIAQAEAAIPEEGIVEVQPEEVPQEEAQVPQEGIVEPKGGETGAIDIEFEASQSDGETKPADGEKKTEKENKVLSQHSSLKEIASERGISTRDALIELGLDETMANLVEHWKNKGDVREYLEAMTTDFGKMSAEQILKQKLSREHPEATEAELALLQKRELRKYSLDNPDLYDETDVSEGRTLFEIDMAKERKLLAEQAKAFQIAAPPEDKSEAKPAAGETPSVEPFIEAIKESDIYRDAAKTGKVTIEVGKDTFRYPANADELIGTLYDNEKFAEALFKQENGQYVPDVEKQFLTAMVAKHGKAFIVEFAKTMKAIGSKKAIDPIDSVPIKTQPNPSATSLPQAKSPAEAMAKYGRVGS